MSSKARFQGKGHVNSSKASNGSGQSKTIVGKQPTGSGPPTKPSQIQVIFNGKICTPQSLVPRKDHTVHTKKAKHDFGVPTIDEAGDINEKTLLKYQRRGSNGPKAFASAIDLSGYRARNVEEEEFCSICLSETDTIINFSMTSFITPSDIREVKEVEERNARYEAVIQAHKNTDNYTSHPTQTMNNPLKNQNEMAAPNAVQDFECQANPYDIKDSTVRKYDGYDNELSPINVSHTSSGTDAIDFDDGTGFTLSVRKFISDTVSVATATPGCLLDPTDLTRQRNPADVHKEHKSKESGKSRIRNGASRMVEETGASKSYVVDPSGRSQGNSDYHSGDGRSSGNIDDKGPERSSEISDAPGGNIPGPHNNAQDTEVEQDTDEIIRERQAQSTLTAPMLLKRLQMLERAVQQNAYHRYHLDYRDLPDLDPLSLTDSDAHDRANANDALFGGLMGLGALNTKYNGKGIPPTEAGIISVEETEVEDGEGATGDSKNELENEANRDARLLFRYSNDDLVQGRAVTSMAWNAVNTDLLAVGYGKIDSFVDDYRPGVSVDEELAGGLVLFWSLRNPDYPEKILRTPHPVTALEFSKLSPMILAVGLQNGDVSVYDVKREFNWTKPIETSANMSKGHVDPVWQVKWVVKGIERVETLVSISTDGSVLEWNLKKGLVVTSLMQLKRTGSIEGWISRTAAGLSFDFVPSDPNTYIVGTEEGAIHRCSVSYNEQYLDSYVGHEGPVYRIRFSTRWPQLFLSAGADWTIHLYHTAIKTPLLSMRTTNEDFAINDVAWCPGNSTIFAAVTGSGKLEIWDLAQSSIDPAVLVDTTRDEEALLASITQEKVVEEVENQGQTSPTTSPVRHDTYTADSKASAVTKLLKNLATIKNQRELTCVQFGERSPTLAVGDNRGAVLIYRVVSPTTITHEGPLQQTQKLKSAVAKQVDPTSAARLAMLDAAGNQREGSLPVPPSNEVKVE